jgi:hypothetical protein
MAIVFVQEVIVVGIDALDVMETVPTATRDALGSLSHMTDTVYVSREASWTTVSMKVSNALQKLVDSLIEMKVNASFLASLSPVKHEYNPV